MSDTHWIHVYLNRLFLHWVCLQLIFHVAHWFAFVRWPLLVYMIFAPITTLLSVPLIIPMHGGKQALLLVSVLLAWMILLWVWFEVPPEAEMDKYGLGDQDLLLVFTNTTFPSLREYAISRQAYHIGAFCLHCIMVIHA